MLQHRCAFLQKMANRKLSVFNRWKSLRAIFPLSQNALERLYRSVILTAAFRSVFCVALKKHASFSSGFRPWSNTTQASGYFVGCMLSKMSKVVRILRQLPFLYKLGIGKFGRGMGGTRDTGLVTVDSLLENPAR